MSSPMKIFFVSRGWPSEKEPQWGSFERDQAVALAALGHQIIVLSVDVRAKFGFRKYGITSQNEKGIHIYNFYAGPFWGRLLKFFSWKSSRSLKRKFFIYLFESVMKREGRPDLLYAHYFGNSEMAVVAKQKYDIPIVGIEHFSAMGKETISDLMRERSEDTYKYLDVLLTVSSSLRSNIKKQLGVDSIVVNNMVGNDFKYVPCGEVHEKVRFVTTGNLLPVKGYDLLIKAFAIAELPKDAWSLSIIGGGSEMDNLKGIIFQNGMDGQITLKGRRNREYIIDTLHNSDVYVLSSRLETFGVAAIEALACGLPVIVTECGGPKDFVNEKNGVTCPTENIEKLAHAIEYMFKHYREYNRELIANDCQNRFSSDAIGRQLEGIFADVISKNKK